MAARSLPPAVALALAALAVAGCALQHTRRLSDPDARGTDVGGPDVAADAPSAVDTVAASDVPMAALDSWSPDATALPDQVVEDLARVDVGEPRDVPVFRDVPPDVPVVVTRDVPTTVPAGGSCAGGAACAPGSECVRFTSGGGREICLACGQLGQRACRIDSALRCATGVVDTIPSRSTGLCVDHSPANNGRPGGNCLRDSDCMTMGQCDPYFGDPVCLTCGRVGLPCCCPGGGMCRCSTGTCTTGSTDGWTVCR